MAEALYRKYRPQIFEDVVGQEHIERTLKNAIDNDKVSHAYLFTGPRGTGKTTTARLLAKALLCQKGPTSEPDGTCEDCQLIANGEHPDVYELDAASRTGVENVREEIIGRVQYAPTRGRRKIYIIDEVHMLSTAAFNALLKTLEEPPSHVVFILATTDPQKVPETIHSRCQRFDFRRISSEAIVSRLGAICMAEGVEFEGDALDLVAHRAEGGMRNALTSLEQLIAFGEGKVTLATAERLLGSLDSSDMAEIVTAIGRRDVAACFVWTANYIETGADLAQFTRDLAEHVRNMYVLTLAGSDAPVEISEATRREIAQEMQLFGPDRLARLLGVLGDLSAELKTSTNPRLSFEIALTRMVRPDSDLTIESLAERVEALESGYSAVAHVDSAVLPSGGEAGVAGGPRTQPAPAGSGVRAEVRGAGAGERVADTGAPRADGGGLAGREPAPSASAGAAAADGAAAGAAGAGAPSGIAAAGDAAPGAAAAASAPAPAAAGALSPQMEASLQNPASLQRIWQAALSALKKSKAAYGVLFLNTKAVYQPSSGSLAIEFPAESSFAFKAVQKPDVTEALEQALVQALGGTVPFSYVQAGAQGSGGAGTGQAAAASRPAAEALRAAPAATAADAAPAASGSAAPAAFGRQEQAPAARRDGAAAASQPGQQRGGGAAAPSAGAAPYDPFDEQVPVDLYDEMPPYADEPAPYGDVPVRPAEPASASRPAGTADAGAASGQTAASPAAANVAAAGAAPASASTARQGSAPVAADGTAPDAAAASPAPAGTAAAGDDDPLGGLLAAFGDGVVIQEVKE